ncbi:TPA: hypothetical protein ACH3X1_009433 [Trebouxia sp. C0004]
MPWTFVPRTSIPVGKRLAWGPTHASRFHTGQQVHAIERFRTQEKGHGSQMGGRVDYSQGKLYARPGQASVDQSPPLLGLQPLGTAARRDGLIYTPKSYQHGRPSPLCIVMHGAGGNAKGALFAPLEDIAEKTGMILVSPQSQSSSWDVIRGAYGPDVQVMDKALQSVFERYTINPQQCSIGGFSDGASYALSIGTTNGELFSHIVAFSPGFMRPGYLVSQIFAMCILAWGHSHHCLLFVSEQHRQ